jgi:F-type H+-transporting ATPase subunit delta
MAGTRAAIRYAKAILDLANSKGVAEAVDTDMKSIAAIVQTRIKYFYQNPLELKWKSTS